VPTARASRTIAAPVQELWELIVDPHHLPRWWPRVTRVEGVAEDAFTEVMSTKQGKIVRADFDVRRDEAARTVTWVQRIAGTPFASVLRSAETQLRLAPAASAGARAAASAFGETREDATAAVGDAGATEVTIELRQELGDGGIRDPRASGRLTMGLMRRAGAPFVRRAAVATIEQALDGLERISA
jgi:uncharacterized protein YndB with AHSA1/START domain